MRYPYAHPTFDTFEVLADDEHSLRDCFAEDPIEARKRKPPIKKVPAPSTSSITLPPGVGRRTGGGPRKPRRESLS